MNLLVLPLGSQAVWGHVGPIPLTCICASLDVPPTAVGAPARAVVVGPRLSMLGAFPGSGVLYVVFARKVNKIKVRVSWAFIVVMVIKTGRVACQAPLTPLQTLHRHCDQYCDPTPPSRVREKGCP